MSTPDERSDLTGAIPPCTAPWPARLSREAAELMLTELWAEHREVYAAAWGVVSAGRETADLIHYAFGGNADHPEN